MIGVPVMPSGSMLPHGSLARGTGVPSGLCQTVEQDGSFDFLHRLIALRKDHPVFGLGSYEELGASNPSVLWRHTRLTS